MEKASNIAKTYCANWNNGKCLGVMIKHKGKKLYQWVDSDLAMKNCIEDKCEYFQNIVLKSINNEKTTKRR
jgi:hypothetical protein